MTLPPSQCILSVYLPLYKASISTDIRVSVMKQFANCYCKKLTNILNDGLKEKSFLNLTKFSEISPVFKKINRNKYQFMLIGVDDSFSDKPGMG